MKKNKEGVNHYNETELVRRGWTKAGVRDFLGEPDWRPNFAMYGEVKQYRLYSEERVHQTEETESFKEWFEKAQVRKEKARDKANKFYDAKEEEYYREREEYLVELLEYVNRKYEKISVRLNNNMPRLDKIRKTAEDDFKPSLSANPFFSETPQEWSDRTTINYIRHNLSDYEHVIYDCSVGRYLAISKKIHYLIGMRFPELQDGCAKRVKYVFSTEGIKLTGELFSEIFESAPSGEVDESLEDSTAVPTA